MTGATIYARQSLDRTGEALAVSRQLDACREFCAAHGWTIDAELVDNDRSATTGGARPAFDQLLDDAPKRVVVWHVDRLARVTRDLERVIDAGMSVHAVKAGHIDLSNAAGRAVARTVTAWATYEGEAKSDRQRAANRQRAKAGVARWTRRPFGFDRVGDKAVIVDDEAAAIRDAAAKLRAGATLASVAADWNAQGVRTTLGKAWSVTGVRRVMLNPRLTGRVIYRGEDMGKHGPAILTDDEHGALVAKLTDPRRKTAPSTRVKYLLSGLVFCEACAEPMFATNTATRTLPKYSVYRCLKCSRVRRREYVDDLVEAVILARLNQPDAARALDPGVDVGALRQQVTEQRERRDSLAALLGEGVLSPAAVKTQARKLTSSIADLERQIDGALGRSPVAELLHADDVGEAWARLGVLDKRDVIRELMMVHIGPAGKGVRFDPSQIIINWRTP